MGGVKYKFTEGECRNRRGNRVKYNAEKRRDTTSLCISLRNPQRPLRFLCFILPKIVPQWTSR